jgi:hypothetical protein
MRNKIWILLCCVFGLNSVAAGQSSGKRQLVLQLATGGFVSFKSETSGTDNKFSNNSQAPTSLIYSEALTDENRIIHRVLSDGAGGVMFGYDLRIDSDRLTKKFSVAVLPAADAFRRSFLKRPPSTRASDLFATFPRSTTPQTLEDGDGLALELLVNSESGLKIVDVVRVAFDSSKLREPVLDAAPKDFTLDAVTLTIKNYDLYIDGAFAGKGRASTICTGSLLWFYVPDRGRFIVSLSARSGYSFTKIGLLDRNRIEFSYKDHYYEWISSESISPIDGPWNVWVLSDPAYTPLFSSAKPLPPDEDKPPGFVEKLGEVMSSGSLPGVKLRIREPPGVTQNTSPVKANVRGRVQVGAADSMDHLLPKALIQKSRM